MTSSHDAAGEQGATKATTGRTILEYVILAIVAIGVALLIQAFLVKPYRIPSESMESTLLIGDRVLVDRISWRLEDPQRQQIVVFHPPFAGPVLIKRIIGMPGDTVSVEDGAVYVNGKKLDEPYVREFNGEPVPSQAFHNGLPWSLESPYKVPAGKYFVMGDNRVDSGDSREFGPVPRAQLVGKAFARYWPVNRIGALH